MPKSRCVNRELTIEFIVGTFMASIVVVLVLFTIVISGGRFNRSSYRVDIKFDQVMGLRRHDNVLVRGMPVGSVKSLTLEPDYVRVVLELNAPLQLREGYRIRVEPSSMLGGSHLVIEEGTGDALPPGTELIGDSPRDVMADVSKLARSVRESLVDDGTLDNLNRITADLSTLAARVERGEGVIGRLLSDDDTLYRDFSETVANLRQTTAQVQRGEGLVGRLIMAEDGLYDDLRESVASVRQLTGRLEQGEGTLGRLLQSDSELYEGLAETVNSLRTVAGRLERGQGTMGRLFSEDEALYDEILVSASNLRQITTRLEQGEGTLGQLLSSDDQLYRDLSGLLENAREALDDLRETTPIITFSSILFGAF